MLGQPSTVAAHQQFRSTEAMEASYASAELAEARNAGGVKGRPQVTLWTRTSPRA